MTKRLVTLLSLFLLSITGAQAVTLTVDGLYTANNQIDEYFFDVSATGNVSIIMDTIADGMDAAFFIFKELPGGTDYQIVGNSGEGARPADWITSGVNIFGKSLKNGYQDDSGTLTPGSNPGTSDPGDNFNLDAGNYLLVTTAASQFPFAVFSNGLLSDGYTNAGNFLGEPFYNGDRNYQIVLTGDFISLPAAVPVPGAVWLFGTAIAGLGVARRKNSMIFSKI
jgi:hypothetical protein